MTGLIKSQFKELSDVHTALNLDISDKNNVTIKGLIGYESIVNNLIIKDDFQISIIIPVNYPEIIPSAIETGGRIPNDFHRNKDKNRTLCLGTQYDQFKIFSKSKTLLNFVNNLLIPYLLSFSYWLKTGNMPYDERSHGAKGILECYYSVFNVNKPNAVLRFFKIIITDQLDYDKCPCGSRKLFNLCHREILEKIKFGVPLNVFMYDYIQVVEYLKDKKIDIPESLFLLKKKDVITNKNDQ